MGKEQKNEPIEIFSLSMAVNPDGSISVSHTITRLASQDENVFSTIQQVLAEFVEEKVTDRQHMFGEGGEIVH